MMNAVLMWLSGWLRVRPIQVDGMPYLERYWLGSAFGWTVYLHRFVAGDRDRWLHDHPWSRAWSLILAGGYVEERVLWLDPARGVVTVEVERRAGRLNRLDARDLHRITTVRPGTWTLFAHRRRCKGWGFMTAAAAAVKRDDADRWWLTYEQPFDAASSADWQDRAPTGREYRARQVTDALVRAAIEDITQPRAAA